MKQDALENKGADSSTVTSELRGETMAFALQSGCHNLAGNLFEPYINYKVQRHYASNNPKMSGNYSQNLLGELAGDVIGAATLMVAEAVIPEQLHAASRKARSWIDPLYTSVAHRVFAKEEGSPEYEKKVEEWKTFQERNLVRSAIVATAGIAGNLATQKLVIGNPSPPQVIFGGKVISTAVTTTMVLGARLAFPDKMQRIDTWVSEKLFKPRLKEKTLRNSENRETTSFANRVSRAEDHPSMSVR